MSSEEILAKASLLPPEKRALLAESVWESLEDPFKAPAQMNEEAALALALQRDHELESGQVKPVSHEDLMARLGR